MTNQYNDKRYTQICSERTLQTNLQGFFLSFADDIADLVGQDWIRNVFGRLKTDRDRIKCIYTDGKIKGAVAEVFGNVQQVYRKKCAETAGKCRSAAETIFKGDDGDKRKALALYSQSALKAPEHDLVWSLFGRAEVLMSLENHQEALADLQQCLKNLPADLKVGAFTRIAICYKHLGEEEKSDISVKIIQKLLNDEIQFNQLKNKLKQQVFNPSKALDEKLNPEITGERYAIFKDASSKIRVEKSKELGRFAVANENINTGETLVVENPYAACLLPEKFGTHCHHCFKRLVAPVGCPDCSGVAFCTPKCRNEAISTYHKYECKFLDLLIGSGMSVLSHAALRMVTRNTCEKNLQIHKESPIFQLCTNSHKRPPSDYLQRALMAGFLLTCLQKSGYFGTERSIRQDVLPISENEFEIGELLLFNLQMLQFNAHEICETLYPHEDRFRGARPAYIGVAVYPTVALFNHDCYPAVTRYFVGKQIVIRAVRPLLRGDLIAENYGPVFTWRSLAERQRSLSGRYWFDCDCSACVENWPSFKAGLDSIAKRVRCPTEKCRHLFALSEKTCENLEEKVCPVCKKHVSLVDEVEMLKRCEGQYDLGHALMMERSVQKAIAILCEALDKFHEISAPPHAPTHRAQETLRLCMADSGNTYEAVLVNKNNKN